MSISIPEEINNIISLNFEIDLGFSLCDFESGFRKRFHNSRYYKYDIVLRLDNNNDELNLWNVFFNETLRYGTETFEIDLNIFDKISIVEIINTPNIKYIENNIFNVSFSVVEQNNIPDLNCIKLNSCLSEFVSIFEGENVDITNNITASSIKKDIALCLVNLNNLIIEDVNEYEEKYILI